MGSSAAVLAGILLGSGRPGEALATLEEVRPTQERLVAEDVLEDPELPDIDLRNFELRRVLAEILARKAEALAALGRTDEAAAAVKRSIGVVETLVEAEPCYLYPLARYLALASTMPEGAGIPDAADRAMAALGQFLAGGFDNPYKLEHDERLEPLRDRDDFRAMVRELREKLEAEVAR
ncbi:MAG: hypothetical protein U0800_18600 [Isosphaeraceae bacterium]